MEKIQKTKKQNMAIIDWTESIVFAICFMVLFYIFAFRIVSVSGSSMEPTLDHEDRLVLQSVFNNIEIGDIVVIDGYVYRGEAIVKRVIAVENDVIDINFKTGEVFVNDELQEEDYIFDTTSKKMDIDFPVTVPEGHIFIMGDNRQNSLDSRSSEIGMVDVRDVLGEAIFRLHPFDKIGGI